MNLLLTSTVSITKQSILYSLLCLVSSSLLTASSAKIAPLSIRNFSEKGFNGGSDPEIPKVTPPPNSPSPVAASPSLKTHSPSSVTSVSSQEMIEDIDQRCVKQPDLIRKIPLRYIPLLFRSCIPYIYQHSKVPIILPAISHPQYTQQWKKDFMNQVYTSYIHYSHIDQISSVKYWLSWSAKSKSGDRIYQGFVSGEEIGPKSSTLAALHTEFKVYALKIFPIGVRRLPSGAPELGGSVALSNGIIGYYFPAMCGANCHGACAKIIWDQGDYRYTVALIMGRREEIIEMANSAIDNQRN